MGSRDWVGVRTSIHLPKRELLLLREVFALPKDSRIGVACRREAARG